MIYLEVVSSPHPTAIGFYPFEFDFLFIGRSKKNDLICLDKELPLHYLTLKIVAEKNTSQLIVQSLTPAPFFFVNGKKIHGSLKIHANDIISFGENKIKIIEYKKTKQERDLREKYLQFEKAAPHLRFALNFIEEMLLDLEEQEHHV